MSASPFTFLHPASLDLSLLIVSFNTRPVLLDCLESVHAHTRDLTYEIFVVDNHSPDASAAAVRDRFPEVRVIENSVNRGFSAANNQALPEIRGRYGVLLNPDTRLLENSFLKIVRYLDAHPEWSLLSPRIVDPHGQTCPMRLWEDSPRDAVRKILGRTDPARELIKMGSGGPREVEVVGGSCFVVRRTVFEAIGLLDENFFLYNEEDDFCRRARKTGHRVCYFPETAVQHLRGCSTHQPGIREKVIVETYRSNLYFFAKYYSQPWNWLLRTLYRLTFGLGILRTLGKRLRGRRLDGPDDSIALKFRLLRMPSGIRRAPPSAGFGPR